MRMTMNNYKQLTDFLNFEVRFKSKFIVIAFYRNYYFAFYKPSLSAPCNCLFLNQNKKISVSEFFAFCSQLQEIDNSNLPDVKDFDFEETIEDDKVYSFCLHLVSFKSLSRLSNVNLDNLNFSREYISFLNKFTECFNENSFFYNHLFNSFALKLTSEKSNHYDIINFTSEFADSLFKKNECFYLSNQQTANPDLVISRNPFYYYFFLINAKPPDNIVLKYMFLTPGDASLNTISSVSKKMYLVEINNYLFLYDDIDDLVFYLEFLCNFITISKNKTVFLKKINQNFSIDFILDIKESATQLFNLISNIQSNYSNIVNSEFIASDFPITSSSVNNTQNKIISINCHTLTASLEACFNELCKHFYLNFKLIRIEKSELSLPLN